MIANSFLSFCFRVRKTVICSVAALLVIPCAHAQQWQQTPLVTRTSQKAGISPGGEGGQVIRSLAISQSDPNFLIMGTDVGGIYRSTDGGHYWQVCMVGWHGRGGNAFTIDPKNTTHVIGLAANGADWNPGWGASPYGLYLSTDQCASWKQVLPNNEANAWQLNSLAFDPKSFDPQRGICTVVYYETQGNGLYKSTDGGSSWNQINKEYSGGQIKVHPTKGFLYLADNSEKAHGFYKSTDGGVTFHKLNDERAATIDVIATRPDSVYLGGIKKVLISTDSGVTFKSAGAAKGLPDTVSLSVLNVDPADPQNMVCSHGGSQWWETFTYVTTDGGENWAKANYIKDNHFLPINQPGNRFAFHPTKPHLVYSIAANGCIVRSDDGGQTYLWSNNGENAIMQGATFGFSPSSPNTVFLSFQDFDAAASADSGQSWVYLNPAGNDWGGYEYGGFTVDGKVMWTGDASGWGGPRILKVSRDGGATWAVAKDANGKEITWAGAHISYSDPRDPNICFASNWRSTDRGLTWSNMTGCDGVFTSNPVGTRELYGRHDSKVCKSVDHGATWTDVTTFLPGIGDIAYDQIRERIYVASEDRVKYFAKGVWTTLDLPKDFNGNTHAGSVAVDPGDPNLVYASGPSNILANDANVCASVDAGKTWVNLTVNTPLKSGHQPGGPHEVTWVRVHPITHDLWAAGECYGMWRISPTAVKAYAAGATHTAGNPTEVPPSAPVAFKLRNGAMTEGDTKPVAWESSWGNVAVSRDTTVFKSAPAALRVSTSGQKGQGGGYQAFDGAAGTQFTVSGWIKSKGATTQVAVQSFDANWKPIEFHQVKWVGVDTDWNAFSDKVTLPSGVVHFTILLLVDGVGEGWLDDVAVSDVQGP